MNNWKNIKIDSSVLVQLTSTSCENNYFIEDKDSKPGRQTFFLYPMFVSVLEVTNLPY